jgi:hypothetical protein
MADFWERYSRSRSAVLGLGILGLVIFMAAIAHMIFPEDPFRLAGRPMSLPGTNGFLLGSDVLGRDVAAGIAHGAKTSLPRRKPFVPGKDIGRPASRNGSSGKIIWAIAAIKITSPRIPKPKTAERLLEYLSQKSAIFMLPQCGGPGMNK